jgi:hypothetical protein
MDQVQCVGMEWVYSVIGMNRVYNGDGTVSSVDLQDLQRHTISCVTAFAAFTGTVHVTIFFLNQATGRIGIFLLSVQLDVNQKIE